jgi:hypothetical protein
MKKIIIAIVLLHLSFSIYAQNISLEPNILRFNPNLGLRTTSVNSPSLQIVSSNTTAQPSLTFVNSSGNFLGTITGSESDNFRFSTNKGFNFQTISGFNFIDAMNISEEGKVGIGTTTPKYLLDVIGNSNSLPDTLASFKYNLSNSLIPYNISIAVGGNGSIFSNNNFFNSDFGLRSSNRLLMHFENAFQISSPTNAVLRVDGSNKVTINPQRIIGSAFVPALADLDVNSTIRSAELDFLENNTTERRPVFADKDGILRVESSSNHYASYNFSSVFPQNSIDEYTKGSGFAWFNTTSGQKTFYLPINLPDGVKITNVRMFLLDNSTSNLAFNFNKNSHLSNTFTTIASAQSSTSMANLFSITDNANEIVDNQNNSYYVNISSSGNWTGNTLQFHSLVITYQYK